MALTITPITVDHLPYLRLLYQGFLVEQAPSYPTFSDADLDQFVLTISRQLQYNPEFGGWVAIRGKKVVGFLAGNIEHRPIGQPSDYALVWWLYVTPRHRHTGVGLRLIDAGVDWLHDRGITMVEVSAVAGDDQWGQRGWTPVTTTYVMSVDAVRLRPQRRLRSLGG